MAPKFRTTGAGALPCRQSSFPARAMGKAIGKLSMFGNARDKDGMITSSESLRNGLQKYSSHLLFCISLGTGRDFVVEWGYSIRKLQGLGTCMGP